jgi:hypothetical protein
MVQFPPKRRGRPPGKVYDLNINLPLTRALADRIEAVLPSSVSRCEFIRRAIARAISPEESQGRAELNRRKGLAGDTSPSASPPLQGRE